MFLICVCTVCHHPIWDEQHGSLNFTHGSLHNGQDLDERDVGVYQIGTNVTYNCDSGILSGGSRTRTCNASGIWYPYHGDSSRLPYTCIQGNYKCNVLPVLVELKWNSQFCA